MKEDYNFSYVFLRYILLIILSLGNLWLFYFIFTPLTVFPSFFVLEQIYLDLAYYYDNARIVIGSSSIELIGACIAGSAYYLMCILNLTTPMALGKRFKSLAFLFAGFLVFNIARIVIFSILFVNDYKYFPQAHEFSWYFLSTLLVVGLWFINVKIFRIENIPIYSDFKMLIEKIKIKKINRVKSKNKVRR
jgi:hypothetical protein